MDVFVIGFVCHLRNCAEQSSVVLVLPSSGIGDRLHGLSRRAPTFFRCLTEIASGQLGLRLSQESFGRNAVFGLGRQSSAKRGISFSTLF